MKLIIAGGRNFNRYSTVISELRKVLSSYHISQVVSGCAKGADTLGERAARHLVFSEEDIIKFPANWELHGKKKAGILRNIDMADYVDIDGILLVFWNGRSTGTKHMIDTMRYRGLPVILIRVKYKD